MRVTPGAVAVVAAAAAVVAAAATAVVAAEVVAEAMQGATGVDQTLLGSRQRHSNSGECNRR